MARILKDNWLLLAFLGVLAAAFLMLRSTPSDIATLEALDNQLNAGRPTVMAFYSNFCGACYLAKPVVDGLERSLQGRVAVLRLDVLSEVGSQAATRYGVRGVPAVVVADGQGHLVFSQVGRIQPDAVLDAIEGLVKSGQRPDSICSCRSRTVRPGQVTSGERFVLVRIESYAHL